MPTRYPDRMLVLFAMTVLLAAVLVNWKRVSAFARPLWEAVFSEESARWFGWALPTLLALMLVASVVGLVVMVVASPRT